MILNEHLQTCGIYSNHQTVVEALDELIFKGFPLSKIFLLCPNNMELKAKNSLFVTKLKEQEQIGSINGTILGLTKCFCLGNLTGSIAGVLLGVGLLCLPGIGQVTTSIAMLFTLISAGVGTATGGVIGSLVGLGLSEAKMQEYNRIIDEGKFLIIIQGTKEEIAYAEDVLTIFQGERTI